MGTHKRLEQCLGKVQDGFVFGNSNGGNGGDCSNLVQKAHAVGQRIERQRVKVVWKNVFCVCD